MPDADAFTPELDELRRRSLLREIRDRAPVTPAAGPSPKIVLADREYVNFASNDYLGLAGSQELSAAARRAEDLYGFGAAASRLLSGGTELHRTLESLMARFKLTDSALVMNSGYTANISAIPSIAREIDCILSDELNHASIVDGCRLSGARRAVYRHGDVEHLRTLMTHEGCRRKVVITDTVFSMDGDIAPLNELVTVCEEGRALLYLDDAHGTGVLGDGRGALHHFGLGPQPWIIQMGTFSKALGSFGAFVAAGSEVVDVLTNTARGFMYSTALPPGVIAASIRAVQLVQERQDLIERLWSNRQRLHQALGSLGFDTMRSETPIIPVAVGDVRATLRLADHLCENGLYAPAIRPPTVATPRIRITVTAAHTTEDLDRLTHVLSRA